MVGGDQRKDWMKTEQRGRTHSDSSMYRVVLESQGKQEICILYNNGNQRQKHLVWPMSGRNISEKKHSGRTHATEGCGHHFPKT